MNTALTHSQPTITFTLTVNINADRSLLLLAGVIWLACRWFSRAVELARAIAVVLWRRVKRALDDADKKIVWQFSTLAYGPVYGIG